MKAVSNSVNKWQNESIVSNSVNTTGNFNSMSPGPFSIQGELPPMNHSAGWYLEDGFMEGYIIDC